MKRIGIAGQGGSFLILTLAKTLKGLSVSVHIEDISFDKALLKLVSPLDTGALTDTEFKNIAVHNGTYDNEDEITLTYLGLVPDIEIPENTDRIIYATDMLPEHIRQLNSSSIRNWRKTHSSENNTIDSEKDYLPEKSEEPVAAESVSKTKQKKNSGNKKSKTEELTKFSNESLFLYDFVKCNFGTSRILALLGTDPGPKYINKVFVNNTDIANRAMLEDATSEIKLRDFSEGYRNAILEILKTILEKDINFKEIKAL